MVFLRVNIGNTNIQTNLPNKAKRVSHENGRKANSLGLLKRDQKIMKQ